MNTFGSDSTLKLGNDSFRYFSLEALEKSGVSGVSQLPFSLKVMLENLLRHEDNVSVTADDIRTVVASVGKRTDQEIAFRPARVLMQDFTGVPAVVDLATMRDVVQQMGGRPDQINPLQPVDLVIDHSVQVDQFGTPSAFAFNAEMEAERNRERYQFLKWGQSAFKNFRVVPPDAGIVHQVNIEYLAQVVFMNQDGDRPTLYPDTLVGTDSHTTMVNGMGVVGWGVGGIEAEGAMLGCPISMLIPEVIGFRMTGSLPEGATATDAVLRVVQMLREKGVVGKFVEFFGPGLQNLSLADRATISNMAPEYGSTIGFFPVDAETLRYMALTGRSAESIARTEAYSKAQGLFLTPDSPEPVFGDSLELDLGSIVPAISGPKRPQDRIPLNEAKSAFATTLSALTGNGSDAKSIPVELGDRNFDLKEGAVVIAAITSCTNTSNPSVMVAAGLLAQKAIDRGLDVKPWVKTSLAPGSRAVTDYLKDAGLLEPLEALRFHLVGYGCTTCIGNSGPLPAPIAAGIKENDLVVTSVLSGNRNFEGRISPLVKANYLASPPLVVAYAIAGNMDVDIVTEPLGNDGEGKPVYLADIWPTQDEIQSAVRQSVKPEMFITAYEKSMAGDERWNSLEAPSGEIYAWDDASTYVKKPPFFEDMTKGASEPTDISGARALAVLGDSVTTDHISPAGSIPLDSPTAEYLKSNGVDPADFNSYGSRRGNHEVMMRGTFGNIRLRNQLAPGTEGGVTVHLPEKKPMSIYDAAMQYQDEGTPLVILAGKEYGSGSSRDWAAKGTRLLGVRAVIAQSYERIHRSNLIGMGVLPLQFVDGQNMSSLGLTGYEEFAISGIADDLKPAKTLNVTATDADGKTTTFEALTRIDTPVEVQYYKNGGILQYVLRQMVE
jgi:aconitate hydratase